MILIGDTVETVVEVVDEDDGMGALPPGAIGIVAAIVTDKFTECPYVRGAVR